MQLVAQVHNINPHPHYEVLNGMLFFLFALHLYWYASFRLASWFELACVAADLACVPQLWMLVSWLHQQYQVYPTLAHDACRSFLILRIAYKQVKEGVTEDVREE